MTARENYRAYRQWRRIAAGLLRQERREYKQAAAAAWRTARLYRDRFQYQLHA